MREASRERLSSSWLARIDHWKLRQPTVQLQMGPLQAVAAEKRKLAKGSHEEDIKLHVTVILSRL